MIYIEFPKDCKIIQDFLLSKNYYASIPECQAIWKDYSSSFDANWLVLPNTEEKLYKCLDIYMLTKHI